VKNLEAIRDEVAYVAKVLAAEHSADLSKLKAEAGQLQRPDFIWRAPLQSFGTMGRAMGWIGLSKPENYNRVTFEALAALPASDRLKVAELACRNGKVRMPGVKARYITRCFEYVQILGGPKAAKKRLLRYAGRTAKIEFLKTFPGIGDKYARNILMDVYHSDFRDSIAIDARIKSLSRLLGLDFRNYAEHEQFYLDVASKANLNGWELDRLIFSYLGEFRARLNKLDSRRASRMRWIERNLAHDIEDRIE
jgi:hypothetical protein